MTIEEIRGYQQLRTPDYAALANCVNRAKGPNRTMAQFAEDTGISASTLSRIVNMNIKKPMAIDLIIKIFEKRADQEDEYLLESMARANGLMSQDYAERLQARTSIMARRNDEINRELMMKNAIIAGVVACGMPVARVVNTPLLRKSELHPLQPSRVGDFVLMLQDGSNMAGVNQWAFFLFPQLIDESEDERRRPAYHNVRYILEKLNSWFVLDAWAPEYMAGMKLSFAFLDTQLFNQFCEAVQKAKLHTEMTILLLDQSNYSVLTEVWIPGEYQQMTNISVFQVPAPCSEGDDEYDDYVEDETEESEWQN